MGSQGTAQLLAGFLTVVPYTEGFFRALEFDHIIMEPNIVGYFPRQREISLEF